MTDYPSELRRDVLTNTWVACAPIRNGRPIKTSAETSPSAPSPETPADGCPFCPGHEDEVPDILWELDADDNRPWATRSVPNKYPALESHVASETSDGGLYQTRSSRGHQEVLIDTPDHNQDLAQMPVEQVEAVLHTYRARYRALRRTAPDLYPFVFRNHGSRAGASIAHPHSQIIALDVPPPRIEEEETAARERYEDTGQCPYCEMIAEELQAEIRLVATNDAFVMFVPFAAQMPYELWILPRRHDPEFGHMTSDERSALAPLLHTAARRYCVHLDDPAFNLYVRTALQHAPDAPHLHWHLRLRPRTSRRAGFELSTGVQVNPSLPERDAKHLRTEL
ncbi:MAG: galactose-1-phosphate uridylyltransferase [Bacteroidetes bacterium SW_9_63_38]|nr:MAG: galactose-1-phosphate uridylyltransferase [Bacteroidetes bacterium SW_9_63_38]